MQNDLVCATRSSFIVFPSYRPLAWMSKESRCRVPGRKGGEMILRNIDELVGLAKFRGRRRVAVARADDVGVLEGLKLAWNEELVDPVLFGDRARIQQVMKEIDLEVDWPIENTGSDDRECARAAIAAVKGGEAEMLMKGQMHTAELFQAVLDKRHGMPRHGVLSHIAFVAIDRYHKLFATTDGGLNVSPDFDQKVEILRNAIRAFARLGYERPKVALLSYVEQVRDGDPETTAWARIAEMAAGGEFGAALVDGPLALDLCLDPEAVRVKSCTSAVAGDADAIVAPNITACNATTKALLLDGGVAAGVVVGASAPIIALSRGDAPRIRVYSIAAASALS
jgi:phosphate butyryltransferase